MRLVFGLQNLYTTAFYGLLMKLTLIELLDDTYLRYPLKLKNYNADLAVLEGGLLFDSKRCVISCPDFKQHHTLYRGVCMGDAAPIQCLL